MRNYSPSSENVDDDSSDDSNEGGNVDVDIDESDDSEDGNLLIDDTRGASRYEFLTRVTLVSL